MVHFVAAAVARSGAALDNRGNLLRFLDDGGIESTNNRAERALRGDSA